MVLNEKKVKKNWNTIDISIEYLNAWLPVIKYSV